MLEAGVQGQGRAPLKAPGRVFPGRGQRDLEANLVSLAYSCVPPTSASALTGPSPRVSLPTSSSEDTGPRVRAALAPCAGLSPGLHPKDPIPTRTNTQGYIVILGVGTGTYLLGDTIQPPQEESSSPLCCPLEL